MKRRNLTGFAAAGLGAMLLATGHSRKRSRQHTGGGGWVTGLVSARVIPRPWWKYCRCPGWTCKHTAQNDGAARPAAATASSLPRTPACSRSPVCGNRLTPGRQALQRVQWEQTLGYTFTYPYVLPPGAGGVPSVALDSKGNLWVFQRKAAGSPQLYKFDADYKLILQIGDDVIGHQERRMAWTSMQRTTFGSPTRMAPP